MSLSREEQAIQAANMAKLRAQMRRNRVHAHTAAGKSINHQGIQQLLAAARSDEEVAAILQRFGINP